MTDETEAKLNCKLDRIISFWADILAVCGGPAGFAKVVRHGITSVGGVLVGGGCMVPGWMATAATWLGGLMIVAGMLLSFISRVGEVRKAREAEDAHLQRHTAMQDAAIQGQNPGGGNDAAQQPGDVCARLHEACTRATPDAPADLPPPAQPSAKGIASLLLLTFLGLSAAGLASGCACDRAAYVRISGGTNTVAIVLLSDGGASVLSGLDTNVQHAVFEAIAEGAVKGAK